MQDVDVNAKEIFGWKKTFLYALDDTAPQAPQPPQITLPLMPHQRALLSRLIETELARNTGLRVFDTPDTYVLTNIGIIGDSVGAGKSLVALSLCAQGHKIPVISSSIDAPRPRPDNYMLRPDNFVVVKDIAIAPPPQCNLIIVPHESVNQWKMYITTQTSLSHCILKSPGSAFSDEGVTCAQIKAACVTLMSSKVFDVYSRLPPEGSVRKIHWKRIFIDEADTIRLKRDTQKWITYDLILYNADYIWLITANYDNILNHRCGDYYIYRKDVENIPELCALIGDNVSYKHEYIKPWSYIILELSKAINSATNWRLVNRCTATFIKESFELPLIYKRYIKCRVLREMSIVAEAMDDRFAALLNANDISGIYDLLGVEQKSTDGIIATIRHQLGSEISRLEAITPIDDKEAEKLHGEIEHYKASKNRVEALLNTFRTELCGICFCEFRIPVMTRCCNMVWCYDCLKRATQNSLQMQVGPHTQNSLQMQTCPGCRTPFNKSLQKSIEFIAPQMLPLKTKDVAFKEFLKVAPTNARILCFSENDASFVALKAVCKELGVPSRVLRGSLSVITAAIDKFSTGDLQVLFLNAHRHGAGLNITAATHIVVFHHLDKAIERQVIGCAYSLERTDPLDVIYLAAPEEYPAISR